MTAPITALLRRPAAWLPIVMSALALGLVLGYVAVFGATPQGPHDEGAPARLFQLILLADGVAMAVFAMRWLPRAPREAAVILALQLMSVAIPVVTVVALESMV
jgi:hypothetical protein